MATDEFPFALPYTVRVTPEPFPIRLELLKNAEIPLQEPECVTPVNVPVTLLDTVAELVTVVVEFKATAGNWMEDGETVRPPVAAVQLAPLFTFGTTLTVAWLAPG